MSEVWKTYAKLPGYEVSSLGNVRNAKRKKVIAPFHLRGGARIVNLSIRGKRKSVRVARMVAETFLPNPDGLPYVGHSDGDLSNDRIDNLKWMTMVQICHIPQIHSRMGNREKSVKGTNILTGETITFPSMVEAADWLRENGHPKAAPSHICDCCLERIVKAYGHFWSYVKEES